MARLNRQKNRRYKKSSDKRIARAKKTRKINWINWLNFTLILGLYAIEFRNYLGF